MLRFGKTKVAREIFYGAKKPINIWDINIDNVVTSKLIETNNNSKYLIGYLDEVIKPLILILPKMSEHIKTFSNKDGIKNNKWMCQKRCQKMLQNVNLLQSFLLILYFFRKTNIICKYI